jgi:hypothetical protein
MVQDSERSGAKGEGFVESFSEIGGTSDSSDFGSEKEIISPSSMESPGSAAVKTCQTTCITDSVYMYNLTPTADESITSCLESQSPQRVTLGRRKASAS